MSQDPLGLQGAYFPAYDQLYTRIDKDTIDSDFKRAENEKERERLKRCWLCIIDYKRLCDGHRDFSLNQRMDALTAYVEGLGVSRYRSRVPELSPGQSLQTVVDEIISGSEISFAVLGPRSQKVGEADEDHRFVCIFCLEVKKKTGDIRTHLIRKHSCDPDDVRHIFHRSNPQGLRVFGQYSYADVCTNRWDIKDWRNRKQRSDGSSDVKRRSETALKPTTKPLKASRVSSATIQEEYLEEQSSQSIVTTQDISTRSPTSPSTQLSRDGYFPAMPSIAGNVEFGVPEESCSVEDSTADLQLSGNQFLANSSKDSVIGFPDGSGWPASFSAPGIVTSASDSLESIDPKLLTAPSLRTYDTWQFGSLHQAHRSRGT